MDKKIIGLIYFFIDYFLIQYRNNHVSRILDKAYVKAKPNQKIETQC
jgi:hypothetical protein